MSRCGRGRACGAAVAGADGGLHEPVQLQPGRGPLGQGVIHQDRDGVAEGQRSAAAEDSGSGSWSAWAVNKSSGIGSGAR